MYTYSICFQLFPFKHRLIADKTASFKVLQLRYACLPTDKLLPDRFLLKTGQSIPVSRLKYREIRDRFFAYSYERARKRLE